MTITDNRLQIILILDIGFIFDYENRANSLAQRIQLNSFCLLYQQVFKGNDNRTGIVTNYVDSKIVARSIRILPRTWHGHPALRVELYSCYTVSSFMNKNRCISVIQKDFCISEMSVVLEWCIRNTYSSGRGRAFVRNEYFDLSKKEIFK